MGNLFNMLVDYNFSGLIGKSSMEEETQFFLMLRWTKKPPMGEGKQSFLSLKKKPPVGRRKNNPS